MLLDSDANRLRHMLEAAEVAVAYIEGHSRPDLDADLPLAYFLIKNFEIIGEAASRVTKDFREAHPQIPWRASIDLRNHLVHVYFDIDRDIIWDTAQLFLPDLIQELRKLLAK